MDSFDTMTSDTKLDADDRISVGAEVGSMLSYLAKLPKKNERLFYMTTAISH